MAHMHKPIGSLPLARVGYQSCTVKNLCSSLQGLPKGDLNVCIYLPPQPFRLAGSRHVHSQDQSPNLLCRQLTVLDYTSTYGLTTENSVILSA